MECRAAAEKLGRTAEGGWAWGGGWLHVGEGQGADMGRGMVRAGMGRGEGHEWPSMGARVANWIRGMRPRV